MNEMKLDERLGLVRPTLLLDEIRCRRNIRRMSGRAGLFGARFRPHFKTHQSGVVASWFAEEGTSSCTVSSVEMGLYFAREGWDDILVALSANPREWKDLVELSILARTQILVESPSVIEALDQKLAGRIAQPLDAWVKVDAGYHRTGVEWDDGPALDAVVSSLMGTRTMRLRGFLTHSGHSYHSENPEEVLALHGKALGRLEDVRARFSEGGVSASLTGGKRLELSIGDTPSLSLVHELAGVDEVRPGNFVFYDVMQLRIGACALEDIAVAAVCPVLAVHPSRGEAVIHGGAVHLSKEYVLEDGQPSYGLVCPLTDSGWGNPLPGVRVAALSQEHGILRGSRNDHSLDSLRPGDMVAILPIHSCLTADLFREYVTLSGRRIPMMPRPYWREDRA